MKIYYISPSTIPSRKANSIHVMNMCEALTELGHSVELYFHSNFPPLKKNNETIENFYGINVSNIKLNNYYNKSFHGLEFGIAIYAVLKFILSKIKRSQPKVIISRNLYAAFLIGIILRHKIIYETHAPEHGLRMSLQRALVTSSKIKTVVISRALKKIICKLHTSPESNVYVFHDCAREGAVRFDSSQRKYLQKKMLGKKISVNNYEKKIGYFGHLYSGRGIEIIESLSKIHSNYAFLVYGGNKEEIDNCINKNTCSNLFFMGHVSPKLVRETMGMMDVLLMPYQKSVSIGLKNVDTSKWMSPMKLFEYLSVGVPIISSNISVLKEVLIHEKNCLLVEPDDVNSWSIALHDIIFNNELNEKLGINAYNLYKDKYTWKHRAKGMLSLR